MEMWQNAEFGGERGDVRGRLSDDQTHRDRQWFMQNGSILLRRFTDPHRLLKLQRVLGKVYADVKFAHVLEMELTSRGFPGISDFVLSSAHGELIDALFGDFQYKACHSFSRRMQVAGLLPESGAWQFPLSPHVDASFDLPEFTVKFWVPLQACGIDAPSLAVVHT